MRPKPPKASGDALEMKSGTLCVQSWLFTPEKKVQVKEKHWKNALDRNEADSVGHSIGKKGERPREKEIR